MTIDLSTLSAVWNGFFFAPESGAVLGLFRILVALLLLWDTWKWIEDHEFFLCPKGALGWEDYELGFRKHRFSLLNYLPATSRSVLLVLGLQGVAALALLVGWLPQLSAFILFVTLTSIHHRNVYAINSGDTVRRFFCLFLIFAPSGAALSIGHPGLEGQLISPWSVRLIQILLATLYLRSIFYKIQGQWWREGVATYYVLRVPTWLHHSVPRWLDRQWFYRFTTWGTLVVETALFSLVWVTEFRYPVLVAGVLLHLGLYYFMKIRLFQATMIVGLFAFVDPGDLLRWLESVG